MKTKWDVMLTSTLVICALTTTTIVVYREFAPPKTSPATEQKPIFIENWKSHVERGIRLGPSEAPVQLIEFSDFECPFCASLHTILKAVRNQYPSEVALSYIHYPLPGHRFAEPAARVAECAAEQGRFEAMHDQLFESQNQLGLKPWRAFAADGRIRFSVFEAGCISSRD